MRLSANFLRGAVLVVGSAAVIGSAQASAPAGMNGVWQVGVQLVDCTSGAAQGPAFTSLLAFAGNGTESETTNNPMIMSRAVV